MSAVENERAIRQNELDTDIAVEQKKREIREAQMDAKATLMRRENELRAEQMASPTSSSKTRRKATSSPDRPQNSRTLAEAEAHRVAAG